MKFSDESFLLEKSAPLYAAALWLVGFVFALMPLEAYEAESFLLAFLCVAGSSILIIAGGYGRSLNMGAFLRSPVLLALLGFWILAFISVLASEVPFVSFIYFCFFSVLPLSFFLGCAKAHTRFIAYGLAGLLAALSFAALMQFFFLPDWLFKGLVSWPFANPNSLAGMLSLGFIFSLGWMLGASSRVQSNLALVLAILCVCALLTTGSRGAFIALVVASMFLLLCVPALVKKHKRCLGVLLACAVAVFFALGFAPEAGKAPAEVLHETLTFADPLSQRWELWNSTWTIFKSYPLIGTGIGTFFLYYPEYRGADFNTAGFMAHSEPLQFASETGVVAPILFYALIVAVVVRTVRFLKGEDDQKRILVLTPFFALGALVLHAHVTFHFHVLSLLMASGLLLGFWFVQTKGESVEVKDATICENALRWGMALVLFVSVGIFSQFQASEILTNRAQQKMMAGDMQGFGRDINRAGYLSHNQNARALIAASHIPLGILQLNGPLMPKAEAEKIYEQTVNLLDKAEAANPRLAQTLYHRAELLSYIQPFIKGVSGDQQGLLERAIVLDPLHLSSRMKLANIELRKANEEEALDILKGGMRWRYKNQNPSFYYQKLARLAAELGDSETEIFARAKMAQYQ